ncbi:MULTISPECIES: cytochrome-c oxidase, cbb3-type subunit III [Thalassolituus]|jgi:cytochrome c oxidase cbb3-type subunit 3|uniref:cytochrome-c oxidase, cbb3-type subunit III n=1 Tax=Thalassolituus TaxID=187492 RepID=UPI001E38597C|nr:MULTISPECIES: cytochrome-c oxidase, cbb3-type subunit III [Thalassolituus]MCB2385852.1 cytochrome-c oxidase, cbb3-type subunit III [Thalassolituus alkanivorans]MCB2421702.1 cytochrome-c oxidase, cbb3-type subunit III [Thalassolituus alkanivorans]|tara:strand:- start:784 stop:1707 length:924 start_codon:yes stop_codon:yes gene_type:complete
MLSTFWQVWVAVIVLGSMIGCGVLIMYTSRGQRKDETDQTTGHDYDGIQELDNPLPRWWVFMFWATIVFGFGYLGVYGLGNVNGLLTVEVDGEQVAWSSTNQWKAEVQKFDADIAPLYSKYTATPVEELVKDADALQTGQRLFKSNCAVCHGSTAKGAQGFPNLTDNDWLYGGAPENIKHTLTYGRQGAMPAWGAVLGEEGTTDMVNYVRSLSGLKHDAEAAEKAAPKFQQLCMACHGADGKGSQLVGAPNLTDDIWLYGGSSKQIEFTLKHGRNGKMPAHLEILGNNAEAKIHLLTTYVYSLSHQQ